MFLIDLVVIHKVSFQKEVLVTLSFNNNKAQGLRKEGGEG